MNVVPPCSWPKVLMPVVCLMHVRRRSDAKCTTMKFLAAAAKLLKRRKYISRVMIDRD